MFKTQSAAKLKRRFKQKAKKSQRTLCQERQIAERGYKVARWLQEQKQTPGHIVCPLPPNMANERWHWRTKQKLQDLYCDQMQSLISAGLLPRPPRTLPTQARLVITVYVAQEQDFDNLHSRVKWPLDFLVTAGYLAGDSPHHITVPQGVQQVNDWGEVERLEFEITEV